MIDDEGHPASLKSASGCRVAEDQELPPRAPGLWEAQLAPRRPAHTEGELRAADQVLRGYSGCHWGRASAEEGSRDQNE
jgi:hypothetical protein